MAETWRQTEQYLAPAEHQFMPAGMYDSYPGYPLGSGKVQRGFDALAAALAENKTIILEGFSGTIWADFRERLDAALRARGIQAAWTCVDQALLPEADIDRLIEPFMGGDDPLFGTRFTGKPEDFFSVEGLKALSPDPAAQMNILYGCGASLAGWQGLLVYVDVPRNEIQYRSRAGSVVNLGASKPADAKRMYKRFYFVDWPALTQLISRVLPHIDFVVDSQRIDDPTFMSGADLRAGLSKMSHTYVRPRPWVYPGPWGGTWMRKHITQLTKETPNNATSFELIAPENGVAFMSDNLLCEVCWDFLQFGETQALMGKGSARFGREFPIRYDFLDTFEGGNLSIQCHPRPEYALKHFGETFTQDETYYILDCEVDAHVYLGFRENINPDEFRAVLENSFNESVPVDIEKYVNAIPVHKGDLFLIPGGTIHASGKDCLVLEISATPYNFTFKMYDWLRMDLDGKPRPLNIARAFENLCFDRKGEKVYREHISHPKIIERGADYQIVHLPTHPLHFYDVHRYEFKSAVEIRTDDSPHVLMLVEGTSIFLETEGAERQRFSFAETFVVPAAAGRYRLVNEDGNTAKVTVTFLK